MNQPVRNVRLPVSRDRIVSQVLGSFGFLHYVDQGDRLLLQDGERRMEVALIVSDATAVADALPDRLQFDFIGYSEEEADELIEQYLWHALRMVPPVSAAPGGDG